MRIKVLNYQVYDADFEGKNYKGVKFNYIIKKEDKVTKQGEKEFHGYRVAEGKLPVTFASKFVGAPAIYEAEVEEIISNGGVLNKIVDIEFVSDIDIE
jgi:hypothetical protein